MNGAHLLSGWKYEYSNELSNLMKNVNKKRKKNKQINRFIKLTSDHYKLVSFGYFDMF